MNLGAWLINSAVLLVMLLVLSVIIGVTVATGMSTYDFIREWLSS